MEFIIRSFNPGQAKKVEGRAEITDRREYIVPEHLYNKYFRELRSAMKYLESEDAALSVETVSGFQIEKA